MNGFYRELNVRVVLSYIEIWNDGDKVNFSDEVCFRFILFVVCFEE